MKDLGLNIIFYLHESQLCSTPYDSIFYLLFPCLFVVISNVIYWIRNHICWQVLNTNRKFHIVWRDLLGERVIWRRVVEMPFHLSLLIYQIHTSASRKLIFIFIIRFVCEWVKQIVVMLICFFFSTEASCSSLHGRVYTFIYNFYIQSLIECTLT